MWEKEIEKVLGKMLSESEHCTENVHLIRDSGGGFVSIVMIKSSQNLTGVSKVVFVSSKTMEESFSRKVAIK